MIRQVYYCQNFANVFKGLGGFGGGKGLDRFSVAGSHGLICGFGFVLSHPSEARMGHPFFVVDQDRKKKQMQILRLASAAGIDP